MTLSGEETAIDPLSVAPACALSPGTLLNGLYRIDERLGVGGMGEVYRATNVANDEQDAVKIIGHGLAGRTAVEAMFRKEARVLAGIHSPAVARLKLFARDADLDLLYFVTEFVAGEALLDRLKRQPATPAELRAFMQRMLTGLEAVHAAGAVHRDLSPDNIILPGGDVACAKIIDFGIAKELDPARTTMVGDSFAGKLGYIAPEQLGFSGAQVGPWTDLYSLALVGIAFAAGKPLDMGATVGRAEEARRGAIDLSAVPDDLRPAFARLLAYDWQARPQSAGEVLAMLAGEEVAPPSISAHPPVPAAATLPPLTPAMPATAITRRPPAWLVIAGVVALILVAGGAAVMAGVWSTVGVRQRSQVPPAVAPAPQKALATTALSSTASAPAAGRPGTDCGATVRIAFGAGSGDLDRLGEQGIADVIDLMRKCRAGKVQVIAGADNGDTDADGLADQRADTIRARLSSSGVPARQLDIGTSFGRLGRSDRRALGSAARVRLILP